MSKRGKATENQKRALRLKHERIHVNKKNLEEVARPRRAAATSVYTMNGLPPISEAPSGARVIDARGPYAVAMACRGRFVGFFKKV